MWPPIFHPNEKAFRYTCIGWPNWCCLDRTAKTSPAYRKTRNRPHLGTTDFAGCCWRPKRNSETRVWARDRLAFGYSGLDLRLRQASEKPRAPEMALPEVEAVAEVCPARCCSGSCWRRGESFAGGSIATSRRCRTLWQSTWTSCQSWMTNDFIN